MERAAAGLIVLVAMTFAIGFGVRQINMVKTLEAVSLVSGPGAEYDDIIHWAVHGTWPSPDRDRVRNNVGGRYARNIRREPNGGITAELTLGRFSSSGTWGSAIGRGESTGLLSFRLELLGTQDYPAFTLLCGYAAPLASSKGEVQAVNRTTLDRKDLPPFCR